MKRILIADDVRDMREYLSALLRSKGYDTMEATSGADVVKILQDKDVDLSLLLIDIEMPQLDGIRAVKMVRNSQLRKDLKICFISGSRDKETILRALAAGGNDFMVKPVEPMILLNKVRALLGEQADGIAVARCCMEVSFANFPVPLPFFLVEISEQHAVLTSQLPFEEGKILDFESKEIGQVLGNDGKFQTRIAKITKKDELYTVQLEFVGTHESFREKLRAAVVRGLFQKKSEEQAAAKEGALKK